MLKGRGFLSAGYRLSSLYTGVRSHRPFDLTPQYLGLTLIHSYQQVSHISQTWFLCISNKTQVRALLALTCPKLVCFFFFKFS